jgi:hypothetical protein
MCRDTFGDECGFIIPHSRGSLGSRIQFEGQILWHNPRLKRMIDVPGISISVEIWDRKCLDSQISPEPCTH